MNTFEIAFVDELAYLDKEANPIDWMKRHAAPLALAGSTALGGLGVGAHNMGPVQADVPVHSVQPHASPDLRSFLRQGGKDESMLARSDQGHLLHGLGRAAARSSPGEGPGLLGRLATGVVAGAGRSMHGGNFDPAVHTSLPANHFKSTPGQ